MCPLWAFVVLQNKIGVENDKIQLTITKTVVGEKEYFIFQGIKECPFCRSYCRRLEEKNPRVICGYCKGAKKTPNEFCWSCLNEWQNGGTKHCGNADCSTEGDANVTLRTCGTKTIGEFKDVPSIRACPKCSALTEHTEACKHMNCWGCKYEFCFVCLSDYTSYRKHTCRVAARQVLA